MRTRVPRDHAGAGRRLAGVLLLALGLACAGCGGQRAEPDAPFDYDASAPLEIREDATRRADASTVHTVSFVSPKGGRVPAYIVVPDGPGPFAGVVLQHGLPGSHVNMYSLATDFAHAGAVAVAIDAPFDRRSGPQIRHDARDRADQIQLIVDLRRAVDLLVARRDVDPRRIAYFGVSYGGAIGGLLAGVEHRIAAFVLQVGDGGITYHRLSTPLSPAGKASWFAAMRPIEPLRYIKRHTAPILFQSARDDEAVRAADALNYQRAAPEPKDVRWYAGGHHLPPAATCEAARWLAPKIGIRARAPLCAWTPARRT